MKPLNIRLEDLENSIIPIGFAGENLYRQVRFDCESVFEEYPTAVPSISITPPNGDSYPGVVERSGNIVVWDVTSSDVSSDGLGKIQLSFIVGEVIKKSARGSTWTEASILPNGNPPSGIDDWLTRANAVLEGIPLVINTALAEAKASGEFDGPPGRDGKDGHDGVPGRDGTDGHDGAPGQDGFSPTIKVEDITGGHRITITDATGPHSFDVMDGSTPSIPVTDVQINGTSILSQGVANVPVAGTSNFGVARVKTGTEQPSTSMVADYVGQLYLNTGSTRTGFFICTNINNGVYTWRRIMITNDSIGAINLLGVDSIGEEVAIAIGKGAGRNYSTYAISIGPFSAAYNYGIAIGSSAKTTAHGSGSRTTIQLGNGTNDTANTMQVDSFRMLDADGQIPPERITPVESVSGSTLTITGKAGVRYVCGEVATLDITAPASGCIDVLFESGSTATVLTVTSAKTGVTAIKWAGGFNPSSLDANMTYELNILDGEFGVVGSWM